jgi:hypothetical protein
MSQQRCTGTAIKKECGVRVAALVAGKTWRLRVAAVEAAAAERLPAGRFAGKQRRGAWIDLKRSAQGDKGTWASVQKLLAFCGTLFPEQVMCKYRTHR